LQILPSHNYLNFLKIPNCDPNCDPNLSVKLNSNNSQFERLVHSVS